MIDYQTSMFILAMVWFTMVFIERRRYDMLRIATEDRLKAEAAERASSVRAVTSGKVSLAEVLSVDEARKQ